MMRLGDIYRGVTDTVRDPFSADTTGLADAAGTEIVELEDGARFNLKAGPVRKRLGKAVVRMLAYNGSIPGPTLRVAQGSQVTINVTNQADVETTVHWHGLRLDNRFDGVPRVENFTYGEGGPEVGDPAPHFRLETTGGETLELASFRGVRPVVLVFGSFT